MPPDRNSPLFCVEGIVADNKDPDFQHRIKVTIPMIDENVVFDKWARRMVLFTGSPGYGDFHVPELGSEVLLFGRLGMKHNLYYISVFNEDFIVPADFRSPSVRGIRTDGDYKLMADLDMQLRAGRLHIETDSSVRIIAPGGLFVNDKKV